jgi:AraC-like DNA-binding protein
LSRRTFTRRFRQQTGLTFAAWQRRACLLSALPRLLGGERVTTIAYDLGYSSPAAFTVMFKQLVGLTPNLYRARHSRAQTGGLAEPAEAAARRGRLELY